MLIPEKLLSVPDALKKRPYWVLWKLVTRGDKTTKIPYQINGAPAESNDPATWAEYKDVLAAWKKTKQYAGIGCMIRDPFIAVDFDHCRDPKTGVIEPWALAAVKELISYTEVSPSGEGLHVWCLGSLPDSARNRVGRVEIYCNVRYFTVTGEHVAGTPLTINEIPAGFAASIVTLDPQHAKSAPAPATRTQSSKEKILLLAQGRWKEANYPSQSEGDAAYCRYLAEIHSGDRERIDAEFRKSPLMREKWDVKHDGTRTYGQMTIEKCLESFKAKPIRTLDEADASEIEEEILDWLWPRVLPLGKVCLFTGLMDMGKGLTYVDLIARLIQGEPWPFTETPNQWKDITVGILSSEDDPADTIIPRLIARGLTKEQMKGKVKFWKSVTVTQKEHSEVAEFSLDDDLDLIRERCEAYPELKLIVCDTIDNYFGDKRNINSQQDVRAVLTPLVKLCAEFGVTWLNVAHFGKSKDTPVSQKTLGSTTLAALHRASWGFMPPQCPGEEGERLMLCVKGNFLKPSEKKGYRYNSTGVKVPIRGREVEHGVIKWLGRSEETADENQSASTDEKKEMRSASDWLKEYLSNRPDGDAPKILFAAGRQSGHTEKNLRAAAKLLGVRQPKNGQRGNWQLLKPGAGEQMPLQEGGF